MGNCTVAWRIAIGLFYNSTQGIKKSQMIISYPFPILYYMLMLILLMFKRTLNSLISILMVSVNNVSFSSVAVGVTVCKLFEKYSMEMNTTIDNYRCPELIYVTPLLLFLSGDIENNPGLGESNDDCLSILSQNIRSIKNKLNYVKDNWLDFDKLCFTEAHLDNLVSNDDIKLDNFPRFTVKTVHVILVVY
jgi:hypothetical protein